MALTRWNPWNWLTREEETGSRQELHPWLRMHREMDQLIDNLMSSNPFTKAGDGHKLLAPQMNISESDNEYCIEAEVPGVEPKDVELTIVDGRLMIRGEKKSEQETKDTQYHRMERSFGKFARVLSLPTDADESNVKASFNNGVLKVIVGKKEQAEQSTRKIPIEAAQPEKGNGKKT